MIKISFGYDLLKAKRENKIKLKTKMIFILKKKCNKTLIYYRLLSHGYGRKWLTLVENRPPNDILFSFSYRKLCLCFLTRLTQFVYTKD